MHIWTTLSTILLALTGVFMMFIILLQRGRGGGLAGAFGGAGGQSAFGTKAGDVFTKITIVVAVIWVGMAVAAGFAMQSESHGRFQEDANAAALQEEKKDGVIEPLGGETPQDEAKKSAPVENEKTTTPPAVTEKSPTPPVKPPDSKKPTTPALPSPAPTTPKTSAPAPPK